MGHNPSVRSQGPLLDYHNIQENNSHDLMERDVQRCPFHEHRAVPPCKDKEEQLRFDLLLPKTLRHDERKRKEVWVREYHQSTEQQDMEMVVRVDG